MKDRIIQAVKVLRKGGVVMHATETCYGFAVDIFSEDGLKRLYDLKKMDLAKPVSIMVRSLDEAEHYGVFGEKARVLAEKFWPGPVTIIVPRIDGVGGLPSFLNEGYDSVGIRCPESVVVGELLAGFDGPLTTTSANVSGLLHVYRASDINDQIPDGDFYVLDDGEIPARLPSTIVSFVGDSWKIVREGELAEQVSSFLGGV